MKIKRYALIEGGIDAHPDGQYVSLADYEQFKREREIDTATLGQLWEVFYAARDIEEYVGANSGSTADWPIQLLARGEAEADRVTAMMQRLQDKVKAVKLNPVTVEDWRRFA